MASEREDHGDTSLGPRALSDSAHDMPISSAQSVGTIHQGWVEMVARGDRPARAGRGRRASGLDERPRAEQVVVLADRVGRTGGPQVVAVGTSAAAPGAQVSDRGGGLEDDAAMTPDAAAEVRLEAVGHLHEVLVEPAAVEGGPAAHGEVTADDLLDLLPQRGTERELRAGERLGLLPRLQHLAGDDGDPRLAVGLGVTRHEVATGNDVVVEEQHEVRRRCAQSEVHRARDRRLRHAQPADAPVRRQLVETPVDLGRVSTADWSTTRTSSAAGCARSTWSMVSTSVW